MSAVCACKGLGMFILIWILSVSKDIQEYHRFIVPCGHCNLPAYSRWLIQHQHEIAELRPRLISQVTFATS